MSQRVETEWMASFYSLRLVFEKTHVLYDEFIVQERWTDQCQPWLSARSVVAGIAKIGVE